MMICVVFQAVQRKFKQCDRVSGGKIGIWGKMSITHIRVMRAGLVCVLGWRCCQHIDRSMYWQRLCARAGVGLVLGIATI